MNHSFWHLIITSSYYFLNRHISVPVTFTLFVEVQRRVDMLPLSTYSVSPRYRCIFNTKCAVFVLLRRLVCDVPDVCRTFRNDCLSAFGYCGNYFWNALFRRTSRRAVAEWLDRRALVREIEVWIRTLSFQCFSMDNVHFASVHSAIIIE